jgi:hypothetical protein
MQAHADPPDVDALLDAVQAGNMDRARELLDGGDVGVNDADANGLTASGLRLSTGLSLRAVMQTHADPPDVDDLLDAVEAGNVDRVRELLDGGDVGVNDADADVQCVCVRERRE